jgi:fatty-acyl-CoA synthase
MVNLSAFIRFHARVTPDRLAIIYGEQRVTYSELAARTGTLAGLLAAQGVEPGDVVAALMKNSAAFLELAVAVSHLGGIFLPISYRLAADEVSCIVENAGARLVFADAEFAAQTNGPPRVIRLDEAAQHDIRRLVPAGTAAPPERRRDPNDLFRLMYTSGTTDRPKGVMHSYGNFYWKCMDHVVALGLTAADRLLVVGPLYHVGAFDLPGVAVCSGSVGCSVSSAISTPTRRSPPSSASGLPAPGWRRPC